MMHGSMHRDILNRVSRFNLTEEEQMIYYSFAKILQSFDEKEMIELVECVIKDSKEQSSFSEQ